jgi:hypothetical protein
MARSIFPQTLSKKHNTHTLLFFLKNTTHTHYKTQHTHAEEQNKEEIGFAYKHQNPF